MFRIRVLVAIAVVGTVIGAGALGAGASRLNAKANTVSADKYATSLCTSLSTWTSDINAASSGLSTKLGKVKNGTDAKKVVVSFLQSTVTRTDKLIKQIDTGGVPKTKNGASFAKALHDGLCKARGLFQTAANDGKKLPTSTPSAFNQAMSKISTGLQQGSTDIAAALTTASTQQPSPELTAAFSSNAACTKLGSSAPTSTSTP